MGITYVLEAVRNEVFPPQRLAMSRLAAAPRCHINTRGPILYELGSRNPCLQASYVQWVTELRSVPSTEKINTPQLPFKMAHMACNGHHGGCWRRPHMIEASCKPDPKGPSTHIEGIYRKPELRFPVWKSYLPCIWVLWTLSG